MQLEKELLKNYLELFRLSPQSTKWSASFFANNPPRLLRYQNFCAIAGALKIPYKDINQFEWGDFIGQNQMIVWNDVMELAIKNFQVNPDKYLGDLRKNSGVLMSMYYQLLNTASKVNALVNAGNGVVEANGYHQSYMQILGNISASVYPIHENLLEILYLLLNPTKVTCPLVILVEEFDYQDVDIRKIDMEWI